METDREMQHRTIPLQTLNTLDEMVARAKEIENGISVPITSIPLSTYESVVKSYLASDPSSRTTINQKYPNSYEIVRAFRRVERQFYSFIETEYSELIKTLDSLMTYKGLHEQKRLPKTIDEEFIEDSKILFFVAIHLPRTHELSKKFGNPYEIAGVIQSIFGNVDYPKKNTLKRRVQV